MNRWPLILIILLLCLHFFVAGMWAHQMRLVAQERSSHVLAHRFEKLVVATGESVWCTGLARRMASAALALSTADGNCDARRLVRSQGLSERALELYLFDAGGRMVSASPRFRGPSLAARRLNAGLANVAVDYFAELRQPWWQEPTRDSSRIRQFCRLLGETTRWHHPVARSDRLIRINAFPRRAWVYWRFDAATLPGRVAGMLVLFNRHRLDFERNIVKGLGALAQPRWKVGLWDRADVRASRPPVGMPRRAAVAGVLQYVRDPRAEMRCGDARLVIVPCRERHLLLGLVELPPLRLPVGHWVVLVCWLAWLMRAAVVWRLARVPLRALLLGTLGLAAGIPLLITAFFWNHFIESRRASISAALSQDLEKALVDVDQRFPRLLRERRTFYRGLKDRLEAAPDKTELLASTYDLEVAGQFDTMFFVSSQGVSLRDFSTSAIEVRRLALFPRPQRWRLMKSQLERGLLANPQEVAMILAFDPASQSPLLLVGMKPVNASDVPKMAAQIGRDLIAQSDRDRGVAPPDSESGDDMSMLVLGSVMETQGGNVSQLFGSYRGDFLRLGHESSKSLIYTDVVADSSGRGQSCMIVFHNQQTFERAFFERFFASSSRWPDGVRFFAVSSHDLVTNFPTLNSWRRFGNIEARMRPPRRLWSGPGRLDGKSVLLAALACRYPDHYVLIAARSSADVDRSLRRLSWQLGGLGISLLALLVFIAQWLWSVAVLPAQRLVDGVRAMEDTSHEHRVITNSRDEWADLAETFNETLAGMAELEVARVVQTRLLPPGAVTAGPWTFLGRSVTMSQVGGDYYDARALPDGSLMFAIGDVSGHGVSAALVVAMAKAAFNALIREGVTTPATLLGEMNQLLFNQLQRAKMMTAIVGMARSDGTLQLATAGHNAPYVVLPNSQVRQLRQVSVPLGVSGRARFNDVAVPLPPQGEAALVLYTDGIIEACNPQDEPFDYHRLEQLLRDVSHPTGESVIAAVHDKLRRHTQSNQWQDDVTVAVLWRAE